jgi:hypothetical protein
MPEIKRLNYFTSQFLVEEDFQDEQAYQREMRHRHNRLLHEWGIAAGLEVSQSGDRQVFVSPGTAIDREGQEMVLPASPPPPPLNLSPFGADVTVYITLAYGEAFDEADRYQAGGVDNFTRTTERPHLEAAVAVPPSDGSVIILARVQLDNNGNISAIDPSVRKPAGAAIIPGSVGTSQLADGAVTPAKLADNAVTDSKIRNGAIAEEKLNSSTRNNLGTLTRGPDSDASNLHFHRSIPPQRSRYFAPLTIVPEAGFSISSANLSISSQGIRLNQSGSAVGAYISLHLPNNARLLSLGAVVVNYGNTAGRDLTISLFRASADSLLILSENLLARLSFNSTGESNVDITSNHVVDNNTFRYLIHVRVDILSGQIDISSIFIDYELTSLF